MKCHPAMCFEFYTLSIASGRGGKINPFLLKVVGYQRDFSWAIYMFSTRDLLAFSLTGHLLQRAKGDFNSQLCDDGMVKRSSKAVVKYYYH